MKQTLLVLAAFAWTPGPAAADELTDPSSGSYSGESAPPAPPVLHDERVAQQASADTPGEEGDRGDAVRDSLLRKTVVTVDGDEIGVIRDVGYSAAYGEPVAVVDIDAFIGIGEKLIAIPLSQLQSPEAYADSVMTLYTRDAVEAEEAFDEADFTAIR